MEAKISASYRNLLKYLHTALLVCSLGFCSPSLGQNLYPSYSFRNLSDIHGLSHPNINQCVEDQQGFIWIASKDGLNRYDGEEFFVFKNDPRDSTTIISNDIQTLFVDEENAIWIGTLTKGLDRYNQETQSFEHFTYAGPDSTFPHRINSIVKDSTGNIWIAAHSGLYVLKNPKSNTHFQLQKLPIGTDSMQTLVYHLLIDDKGWLWVAADHGLFVNPEPGNADFRRIVMDSTQVTGIPSDRLTHIFQDRQGYYWISCFGYGLSVHAPLPKDADFLHHEWDFLNLTEGPNRMIPLYPTAIKEDQSGKLIIGAPGSLVIYSKQEIDSLKKAKSIGRTKNITLSGGILSTQANQKFTLPDYMIQDIFISSFESIWVSTRKGIAQLASPKEGISGYNLTDGGNKILIEYLYRSPNRKQLGLFERGKVYLYDWEKKRFSKTYTFEEQIGDIRTVFPLNDSIFWIGGYKGLIELNVYTEHQKVYRFKDLCYEKDCRFLQINEITRGPLGHIYMGTGSGILVFSDHSLKNPYRFFLEGKESYSNWIKCIANGKDGELWVGTNTGLWRVSITGLQDSLIQSQLLLPSASLDSYIRDIEVSRNSDTVWAAVENGVIAYSSESKQSYTLPNIFEEVNFLSLDPTETHLWGSTVGRIFDYDIKDSSLTYFNHFDGLNSEYIRNASTFDNDLYVFGSNPGFTHIDLGKSYVKRNNASKLHFTRYETKGKSHFISPQLKQKGLRFLPGVDYFTIYFSRLDFAKEGETYFSYRLKGFDEDWIDINHRNSVSYSNLRQGNYTLEVRSSQDGIKWNPEVAHIQLQIVPPLWKRIWFQWVAILTLLLGATLWQYQRRKQRKARELMLEKIVAQKTMDLRKSEKLLERKNKELTKYIESNMQLENFAYLASHDLKSPLQNIINFSQLIERTLENENRPQVKTAIQYLNEGAMRMKHTVEDLLNFSLVTNNQINPKSIPPKEAIEAVIQDISETLNQSHAEISIQNLPESIIVDESLFRELILNLLTNAVKFVPENRIPKIVISGYTCGEYYRFSIADNGIGIAESHKEKIFGIFKRLHSREEYNGTGIGLAICKKIVERHDGEIWVESRGKNMGSTFNFSFPISPIKNRKDRLLADPVSS